MHAITDRSGNLMPVLLGVFLTLAWCGGGPTVDITPADEWLQLLALPLLVMALASLLMRVEHRESPRWPLFLALAIVAVPLLQLLPLPQAAWAGTQLRARLAADLATAGIAAPDTHWSLIPAATERSLWAMMPALACFLAALASGGARKPMRRVVQLALALVLGNIGFGLFQVGLPEGSPLRLHPGIGSGFSGVLVNDNHHAIALVAGMLLAMGLGARAQRRHGSAEWQRWLYPALALVCLAAIPLTGSRAGMVIGLAFLAVGSVATGLFPLRRLRHSRGAMLAAAAGTALLLVACISAWNWLRVDAQQESRQALAGETTVLGARHAPWGSGVGSFVEVFEQDAPPRFTQREYINHAHNEYAQWWLTGGIAAVLVLLATLAALAWTGWRLLLTAAPDPVAIACWLAVLAVLAHSAVDFPLRTLSLMSLVAMLAGVAVAAATRTHTGAPRRDVALQQA